MIGNKFSKLDPVDLRPGLNELFDKAVFDIYKLYFPNLTDKEILELIKKDKQNNEKAPE